MNFRDLELEYEAITDRDQDYYDERARKVREAQHRLLIQAELDEFDERDPIFSRAAIYNRYQ